MDLKKYLKEPAQLKPDFGWWVDAETFDPEKNHKNPHECKDELDLQWGNGGLTIQTVDNNLPVNLNTRKASIKESIVIATRSMMNAGMKTAAIREYIASNYPAAQISSFSPEIEKQLKLEGCVGRFILDARGYRSCGDALKFANKNPFKKYMKFMIGCNCKNHIKAKQIKASAYVSTGDSVGDLLSNNGGTDEKMNDVCSKTGMRVLSGQGDIDAEWAGNTMIDVMNAADLSDKKKFTASADEPYIRLKRFFIALDNNEILPKEEVVDFSAKPQEDINQAAIPVKLNPVQAVPEVDMTKKNNESVTIKCNPDAPVVEPLPIDNVGGVIVLTEFEKDPEESLPMDLPAEGNKFKLDENNNADIDVGADALPLSTEIAPEDMLGEIDFDVPEDDEFSFDDGTIDLTPEKEGIGLGTFSF